MKIESDPMDWCRCHTRNVVECACACAGQHHGRVLGGRATEARRVVPIGGTQVEVNNRSDRKGEPR